MDFNNIQTLPGGRLIDPRSNLIFPWYTKPFLINMMKWDISNWFVFEYGCGDSTFWWRKNVRDVISVDTNKQWSEKCNTIFINDKNEFIKSSLTFLPENKFDCIIIDGEPVEWRDECTKYALEALKDGGTLIIDNYKQGSVNLEHWRLTDELIKNMVGEVFKEDGHKDWKTGYWIK